MKNGHLTTAIVLRMEGKRRSTNDERFYNRVVETTRRRYLTERRLRLEIAVGGGKNVNIPLPRLFEAVRSKGEEQEIRREAPMVFSTRDTLALETDEQTTIRRERLRSSLMRLDEAYGGRTVG